MDSTTVLIQVGDSVSLQHLTEFYNGCVSQINGSRRVPAKLYDVFVFIHARTVVCKWLSSAISGSGNVHSGVLSVMYDFRGRKLKARWQQTARHLNMQAQKTKHCQIC